MTAVAVVIICDDCGTERRVDGDRFEARRDLRRRGWVHRSINSRRVDLCPPCTTVRYRGATR